MSTVKWPHRLSVRTLPFQGRKRGSIPRGVTKITKNVIFYLYGRIYLRFDRPSMEGCSELVRNRSRKAAPVRACGFKSHPFRLRHDVASAKSDFAMLKHGYCVTKFTRFILNMLSTGDA